MQRPRMKCALSSNLAGKSRFDSHNILFDDRNEDVNSNGQLDAGGTGCGWHSRRCQLCCGPAHVMALGIERDQCVADNLMNFYDRQQLVYLKPLWPMEQRCTAVATKRLKGEKWRRCPSPFPMSITNKAGSESR